MDYVDYSMVARGDFQTFEALKKYCMIPDQPQRSFIDKRWSSLLAFSGFAFLLLASKLWLINAYGNATPFWDQWDAEATKLYKPFLEGTLRWSDFFSAHNEHRIFTTRLLALLLLIINKIWNPLLQMVVNAVLHVATLCYCIALLARVIGRNHLPSLLAFSVILFGTPYAWENTLEGFQSQFYFVLLFSIASLWFTVIKEPITSRWWGGVICAIFAFFSLASGVFACAAAAVIGLAFYVFGLRRTYKQIIGVVILGGLFIIGVILTPTLPYHASLKAASINQFYHALMSVLGWPMSAGLFLALIRNLPGLVMLGIMIWKRPAANDNRWFLAALVIWAFGQAVSIAYGRADGTRAPRYLDLFAMSILINFACLISIAKEVVGKHVRLTFLFVSVWIIAVLMGLGVYEVRHVRGELAEKQATEQAEEVNTRNYLATGDIQYLKDKPRLYIPFPNAERFASILASPTIRSILPSNISTPLKPSSIDSEPPGAFVTNGYYPTTPKRNGMTLGSYSAQGNRATGNATIRFISGNSGALLSIPVAGFPLNESIKLEINQNGLKKPIALRDNPKESWQMAHVNIEKGPFSIKITDLNKSFWLAVGAPVVTGRLDSFINLLLENYPLFIVLGFFIVLLLLIQHGLANVQLSSGEDDIL